MIKARIKVNVKTVPHTNPQRLVDMWSDIVVKELIRRDIEQQTSERGDIT